MKMYKALTSIALALTAVIAPMQGNESKAQEYAKTAIVQVLDYELNEVVTIDTMGNVYTFNGIEDWYQGDMVLLVMNDNGTQENIFDDFIISATYQGHISQFFEQMCDY